MRDGPTTLYRLYDQAGAVLYIGISGSWPWRMVKHNAVAPWWEEVARVDVQQLASRDEALDAEAHAIADERPRYNKAKGRWRRKPHEHLSFGPDDGSVYHLPCRNPACRRP